MKHPANNDTTAAPGRGRKSRRGGMALVLTLGFLVLISGLVIAFFSSVQTEMSSAKTYANGANSKQLADAAVQMVIGAIRDGTSHGGNVAWASQPGMIRTYGSSVNGSEAASNSPLAYYKLYSSDNMVVTSSEIAASGASGYDPGADVAGDWDNNPALYTDLNSPVVSDGVPQFPIIDPRAAGDVKPDQPLVEGFSFSDKLGTETINGVLVPSATTDNNARLPMPVKWVYVLQDGTLTAPDPTSSASNTTVTFEDAKAKNKAPTADNPIVGRIAFWTDDETCKLNLNTACGGNPWDPPMFTSIIDLSFSRFGPVRNEFARYPGHPATTSLQPVFWSFGNLDRPQTNLFPVVSLGTPPGSINASVALPSVTSYSGRTTEESFLKNLLLISPRNMFGGSELAIKQTAGGPTQVSVAQNPTDADRLFSSVDEILFGAGSGTPRPTNVFEDGLDSGTVDKLGFFLTNASRAPEVNMFNLPKVAMWPLPDSVKKIESNPNSTGGEANLTAVDKLIAFCATLNGDPYYFTRYDSTSASNDFASGSRNIDIYDYLDSLFELPVPGFGGEIDGSSGRDGSQILTLCTDYIRSAVNLMDATGVVNPTTDKFQFAYTTPPKVASGASSRVGLNIDANGGTGQVVPLVMPNGTKGIGRFPTVLSANLMFIARRANQPPVEVDASMKPVQPLAINPMHPWVGAAATGATSSGTTVTASGQYPAHPGMPYSGKDLTAANGPFQPNLTYAGPTLKPYETQMEAIFFIDPANVAVGSVGIATNYRIEVDGLNNLKIRNSAGTMVPLFQNMPDGTSEIAQYDANVMAVTSGTRAVAYRYGGDGNYDIGKETHTILRSSAGIGRDKLNYWSGVSNSLIVGPLSSGGNKYGQSFEFQGGDIKVRIYPATGSVPVQELTIKFPDSNNGFPTPRLIAYKPVGGVSLLPAGVDVANLSFDGGSKLLPNSRLFLNSSGNDNSAVNFPSFHFTIPESNSTSDPKGRYKLAVDTIRSVECKYGDTRIIAGLTNVPSTFFAPHKFYQDNLGTYDVANAMWSRPAARSAHTLRRSGEDRYAQAYNGAVTGATVQPLTDFIQISAPTLAYYGDYGLPAGADDTTKLVMASYKPGLMPTGYSVTNNRFSNNWPHTTSSVDFSDPQFEAIWKKGGDFDNGPTDHGDGPYINKAIEGTDNYGNSSPNPDYDPTNLITSQYIFSPNRQVPSSVMFGSLPRGINKTDMNGTLSSSWQTLLFCPNPNSQTHVALDEVNLGGLSPKAGKAPDFLLLDFFNMPVVEPYAISEPFSTAGKVNMNYQIAPFTYIKRDTALRGVLGSTFLTAVADKWIRIYKNKYFYKLDPALDAEAANTGNWYFRFPIHADQTLQQFQNRFDKGDIFRSASEICSLFLYPAKQPSTTSDVSQLASGVNADTPGSSTNIQNWWYSGAGGERKSLTGDNMRERPYALIYPRLTTKSNTYTVHFRVQTLRKAIGTDATKWIENKDKIVGEYRGSSQIERYIDPSDPDLPDFALPANRANGSSLDHFPDPKNAGAFKSAYKFRVLSTKKFGS